MFQRFLQDFIKVLNTGKPTRLGDTVQQQLLTVAQVPDLIKFGSTEPLNLRQFDNKLVKMKVYKEV
jgi:hypothetical protein